MLGQGQNGSDKFSMLRPIENPNKRKKMDPLKDSGEYGSEEEDLD